MNMRKRFCCLLLVLLCSGSIVRGAGSLDGISNWIYLDQEAFKFVGAMKFSLNELIVLDPVEASGKLITADQVTSLKGNGRLVFAAMYIALATEGAPYWQPGWTLGNPPFLVERAQFPGEDAVEYFVDYSHPDWHKVLFGSPGAQLDKIAAAGYDGVVLGPVELDDEDPGRQVQALAKLLADMRTYIRARKPNFSIFLLSDGPLLGEEAILASVDGVIGEGLTCVDENQIRPPAEVTALTEALQKASIQKKLVLTIDRATDKQIAEKAWADSDKLGYLPYIVGYDQAGEVAAKAAVADVEEVADVELRKSRRELYYLVGLGMAVLLATLLFRPSKK